MQYQEITPDQIGSLKARNAQMGKGEYKAAKLKSKPNPQGLTAKKPAWIKAKLPPIEQMGNIRQIKNLMRELNLHSVCEEASCPNLGECFGHGTATFMIMGSICTRKCPFCDVAHGRPMPLDTNEPEHLAKAISHLGLKYVVITSVDRDDLRDGGAGHFAECIRQLRQHAPDLTIETLVPDFKGCMEKALEILIASPPDVLNHNLETIPRLYDHCRPDASYQGSLDLLKAFGQAHPQIPTKSGLMVGLGEELDEVLEVMRDLRAHGVSMLTVGQYLQPSAHHLPVSRFVTPEEFKILETQGYAMGFTHVAAGPMVRSSYHADLQAKGEFGCH